MDFQAEYRSKLRTPAEAVRAVKNGDWVDYTSALGFPPLLMRRSPPGATSCTM